MRKIFLLFLLNSCFVFGQKKKYYGREITSNIEARATLMKPFGNNFLAKDHQMFYGFGFGGNMMTPINFGLGIDYNVLFSNIKYGHENIAGNISGPVLTNIEFYLVHRNVFSEEFTLEEFGGASSYVLSTAYNEAISERHKDKGVGFHFGLKPIYTLDREGYQKAFVSGKVNFYFSDVYNSDAAMQKYFSRSMFLSLSIGYRYQF